MGSALHLDFLDVTSEEDEAFAALERQAAERIAPPRPVVVPESQTYEEKADAGTSKPIQPCIGV